MQRRGMSLRYKILTALTLLPLVGLSLFLWLAIHIFEKDKIAYIFDSTLSVSKNKAARVGSEVNSLVNLAQSVVLSFEANTKTLAESGQYLFNSQEKFLGFALYTKSSLGAYERAIDLSKDEAKELIESDQVRVQSFFEQLKDRSVLLIRAGDDSPNIWLFARFGDVSDPNHQITVSLFSGSEFVEMFGATRGNISFLLQDKGEALFAKDITEKVGTIEGVWKPRDIWQSLSSKNTPEGSAELISPSGQAYLVSFSKAGVSDLVVLTTVNKESALAAINMLLRKSFLFFLAVLSITVIFSVLASRGLTSALRGLLLATQKVAEGDFDVRVTVTSRDEIGSLGTSFNVMAEEVSRLMKETAEKARMESELATAKTVQETLFPNSTATLGTVEIAGHYQPASECGGDWWYYSENGDQVYLWIADATGHGAPAALLTSAVRAVVSVIQNGPALSPAQSISILNRAICETSKGKMMMTFFLGCIDKNTGIMTYSNASHEAPLLLKKTDSMPTRDDYIPLNEINNPRLGEQPNYVFKEASIQLDPGDRIVLYTDGVVDVKNTDDKAWGERKFLKTMSSALYEHAESETALAGVVATIQDYRQETPLDDDVTLIVCRYRGAA